MARRKQRSWAPRKRHDLKTLTQGAIAGALALGGLVAAVPLKAAASAYDVVHEEVMQETSGFPAGLGYHLSQMFYPVLLPVQDDLAVVRAVRSGRLDDVYAGFGNTADLCLLVSAAGMTFLSMLYVRILLRRRPRDGRRREAEASVGIFLMRGIIAVLLSPLFFHALRGVLTLIEHYSRIVDLSWDRLLPLLQAVGVDIVADLQDRWQYTAYAAGVGAVLYVVLRRARPRRA